MSRLPLFLFVAGLLAHLASCLAHDFSTVKSTPTQQQAAPSRKRAAAPAEAAQDLETICREYEASNNGEWYRNLQKRQLPPVDLPPLPSASVGPVDITLPSVGLTLGNITTKIGNINLTVDDVLVTAGDISIEDITIGDITVIVSVPLPGQSPITPFSAPGSAALPTAPASSSSSTGSTEPTESPEGFVRRQEPSDSEIATVTVTATATPTDGGGGGIVIGGPTVSANPIDIGAGSVDTEIGNITIRVQNVNVTIGSITMKNITIGDVFVLVQIGQPDLGGLANIVGAVGNLTSTL